MKRPGSGKDGKSKRQHVKRRHVIDKKYKATTARVRRKEEKYGLAQILT